MRKNRLIFNYLMIIIICISGLLTACRSDGNKKKDQEINLEDFISNDEIFNDIDKAKKIFYSLPSPLETAMLIKSSGAEYDEQLLNSINNVDKYTTNKSLALNLGIYTTDLSFASLFDQTQTSIKYMEAARKMADGLDITDAIDDQTIKRIEENLDNRDVIMDIISETFLNSSSYLKENDRAEVAAIVLFGGWIEGLYIAAELVGDKPIEDNELVKRIAEQKLSFSLVQRMLEDNRLNENGETNQDIVELMVQLQTLKDAYNKITVETSEVTVEQGKDESVANLKSTTEIKMDQDAFNNLRKTVRNLRTKFIQ